MRKDYRMQNPNIHPEPESVPELVLDLYETMKKTLLRKYLWVLDTRKEMLAGQGRQEQTAITFCRPDCSDPVVLKDDPSKGISKVSTFEEGVGMCVNKVSFHYRFDGCSYEFCLYGEKYGERVSFRYTYQS